ncbi:MAG: kinase/pyrophosphorylase [Alphaproteobacteria bacterium]|nr:kinase/pyrophosphorylase [Alphaproteobacteria bacterium]
MNKFHVHLVSDATGDTLNAVAKAAAALFENVEPAFHIWPMLRSAAQIERALQGISVHPGLVLFTLVDPELRQALERGVRDLDMPAVPVLDPVLTAMSTYLGLRPKAEPGRQHHLDSEYFARIEAINYTLQHDDGQSPQTLYKADIVLVGVSRTSKTPTSIYLANRGIKAANVPIVPGVAVPSELEGITGPLVVGLTTSVDRLVQVRRNRLLSLSQDAETEYVDQERVKEELAEARKLYARHDWPVIDVTRRSIEETAAAILQMYQRRLDKD